MRNLFLSTVLIDAKTMPNGHHTWNNSRFRLKRLILLLRYAADACRSGGEEMKPFSASVQWGIVLLQDAIARVQSFIELLQSGNAHDAMGRWITSKSESLVDKMMMNCYKIKTERMERYGWIRWSWITGSGNEQIGLRWNVIHLTKTFVAYWISESFCWLNLNRSLDCFAPTNILSI